PGLTARRCSPVGQTPPPPVGGDAVDLPRRRAAVGRKAPVGVVVVVQGEGELLDVVCAPNPRRGLADLLDGGGEQRDGDGDDGYHHQQLDQRETAATHRYGRHGSPSVGANEGRRIARLPAGQAVRKASRPATRRATPDNPPRTTSTNRPRNEARSSR